MAPSRGATILHVDLDAFYASVEQLLDPSLRGKPVAVGSGVVLAASYEARAFGVAAGMPAWRARRLCPGMLFAGGHFGEYQRLADQVIDVFRDFTPLVERVSIDEAFLDVAGSVHLFGPPAAIAAEIRRRVRAESGLAVSVGVARTKHLAKVASQVAKPDGLVVVEPGDEMTFLHPLPVGLIWGVGPVTRARLASAGIRTVGELAETGAPTLESLLGRAAGGKLDSLAANRDPRASSHPGGRPQWAPSAPSGAGVRHPSCSGPRSATSPTASPAGCGPRDGPGARSPCVCASRACDPSPALSRCRWRFPRPSRSPSWRPSWPPARLADHPAEAEVTLLGVSVSNLVGQPSLQLELPLGLDGERYRPGATAGSARWAVDRSVDAIRGRFGRESVGYAGVVLSGEAHVPEAFRELAEHGGYR